MRFTLNAGESRLLSVGRWVLLARSILQMDITLDLLTNKTCVQRYVDPMLYFLWAFYP